ncbi:SpoIIE family protein phosphatase [Leptospira sp. GIMC2001]|uniref:SpoIIE family protein phosphatase n=1 Tax=Leptospira sp. GIMC2001 TaxID=1513297 RepID=UPI00234A157A|nr:SpoIIE family protein phosphatase [Leptospira sp. GIMC2001]WCL50417.1 SpoIIE family protein phosphatase [Leptospira sp. GIMC2001]
MSKILRFLFSDFESRNSIQAEEDLYFPKNSQVNRFRKGNQEKLSFDIGFYRKILLITSIIIPVFSYAISNFYSGIHRPLWIRILFFAIPLIIFVLSYFSPFVRRNVRKFYFACGYSASPFLIYLIYRNDFFSFYIFSFIFTIFAVTISIVTKRELIYFLLYIIILDMIGLFIFSKYPNPVELEFSKIYIFHAYIFVASLISYSIISSRLEQIIRLEKTEEFKNRVEGFLDEARQELENIKLALETSSMVAILDKSGNIIYANENFIRITGYSNIADEGERQNFLNSGQHSREYFLRLWNMIESGNVWSGELCNLRRNGHVYWMSTTIVPIFDSSTIPERFLVVGYDITLRKLNEVKLVQSEEKYRSLYNSIKHDLLLASEAQKILIPEPQNIPSLTIKSFVHPFMEVSGDIILPHYVNETCVEIFLADIAGHGIAPALVSAVVVMAYYDHAKELNHNDQPLDTILVSIRDRIKNIMMDQFISGVYLRYNANTRILKYTYAGHLPGILLRDGELIFIQGEGTPLLSEYKLNLCEYSIQLYANDRILFFTDGAYELSNTNSDILGYDSFIKIAAEELKHLDKNPIANIFKKLIDFSDNNFQDDLSLLFLQIE